MRQSVFSCLAGYEDTNDAERLSVDPAMRYVVGGRAGEHQAASTSQMSRFETEVLTQTENLSALKKMPGMWNKRLHQPRPMKELVLDMDSSVSETYGDQEGSAYNGHFACTCYHPLFCFNQFGDVEGTLLREDNVHSAKDWQAVLEPIQIVTFWELKMTCQRPALARSLQKRWEYRLQTMNIESNGKSR